MKVWLNTSRTHPLTAKARAGRFGGGFSLLELLVVIAIIGLLLSIMMPALGKARSIAMRLKCASNLKQINLAMHLYMHGNDQTYPCKQGPFPGGYQLWMGLWGSLVEPYLGVKITPERPSIMVCPQDPKQEGSFSYAYSMSFYYSPSQINTMNSYEDTFLTTLPVTRQRGANVARPSGKILVGEWYSNHLSIRFDQGWWVWEGTRNYLFADGQVRFFEAKEIRQARDWLPDPHLTYDGIKGFDWPAQESP